MAITPTFAGTVPTVGGSADTWGGTINTGLGQIKVDIDAIALQFNVTQGLASGALQRSGGDMSGEIYIADVAPTNIRTVGFRGLPVVNTNANKTIAATDSGKLIRFFDGSPLTLTVPTNAAVALPIGTVVAVRNFMNATLTIAPASGVTLALAGGGFISGTRTMVSSGFGTLIKEDTNLWVITGTGVA